VAFTVQNPWQKYTIVSILLEKKVESVSFLRSNINKLGSFELFNQSVEEQNQKLYIMFL